MSLLRYNCVLYSHYSQIYKKKNSALMQRGEKWRISKIEDYLSGSKIPNYKLNIVIVFHITEELNFVLPGIYLAVARFGFLLWVWSSL